MNMKRSGTATHIDNLSNFSEEIVKENEQLSRKNEGMQRNHSKAKEELKSEVNEILTTQVEIWIDKKVDKVDLKKNHRTIEGRQERGRKRNDQGYRN